MYKEDYEEVMSNGGSLIVCDVNTPKKIIQLSIDGDEIATFNSSYSAVKSLGRDNGNGNIDKCCRGERLAAYGFKWIYG
ncbi:hypothetical protein [Bacillus sp. S0628]|uniref:hypothetical protein n=1 Tax=Bacillus sp. S0628 TaxID=2957802 RepID=UPI00209D2BA9|nr:hypothetical protein [Bacillus sp. S0628]MCP1324313.1 hypothetical protein [Bacillus sp. S0628]